MFKFRRKSNYNKVYKYKVRRRGGGYGVKCSCGWVGGFNGSDVLVENGQYKWVYHRRDAERYGDQHVAREHPAPLLNKKEILETYEV